MVRTDNIDGFFKYLHTMLKMELKYLEASKGHTNEDYHKGGVDKIISIMNVADRFLRRS